MKVSRREMLTHSLRNLSRALPGMISVAGELSGLLRCDEDEQPVAQPGCFPSLPTQPVPDESQDMEQKAENQKPNILIAGLGNLLLKDDGIGVHAVYELQKDPPPDVCICEVGTAVLDALHLFEWADKILAIDAMQAGGKSGTIYSFRPDDVEDSNLKASLHEVSLVSALRFLPEKTNKPEITILGVEPESIDYSLELSESVQTALPELVKVVRRIIEDWQADTKPDSEYNERAALERK